MDGEQRVEERGEETGEGQAGADDVHLTRSSRDREALRARLGAWLRERVGDPAAEVVEVRVPDANGMSSETLLVDAAWDDGDGRRLRELVARVAPADEDVPVFPSYDLDAQYRAMALVGERTSVPVPRVRWSEADPAVLGAPFFVMDRVEGRVPPDVMPYTFEGWLFDATAEERRSLQDAHVGLLAGIHSLDPAALAGAGVDVSFLELPGQGSALRRHVEHWRSYYDWMRGDLRYPLLEAAFAWLERAWPDDEGEVVVSWGDARIGNVVFDGFAPAAVLDWEMAGVGPRGMDLAWTVFLHVFFQDITEVMGLPGLPDMFRPDDVVATYEALTGVPGERLDLDFHLVYAALRHGVVMARVHQRRVHFGEAEPVADPDEAVMHRDRLADLIAG